MSNVTRIYRSSNDRTPRRNSRGKAQTLARKAERAAKYAQVAL